MSSIVAMTALQSPIASMKNMETTQSRISTGLRVNTAADNAAYWSIATTMHPDKSAMSTVSDALNFGSSTLDVAYTGMNAAIDVTNQIKTKLVATAQSGVDRSKIQAQLKTNADSAVFSRQNWPSVNSGSAGYKATESIVSSLTSYTAGAISSMTSAGATMGPAKARVAMQQSFVSSLMDSIDKGAGSLVDADMNPESTKLQVQQQLGIQALSIANQSTQSILSLFRS